MNKAESAALENLLTEEGFSKASTPGSADLVILNTCSVRISAENRIWGRLGFYQNLKKSHSFTLVVIGCMAERLKETLLEAAPVIDLVVSNFSKLDLKMILSKEEIKKKSYISSEEEEYSFFTAHHEKGSFKSFIPIMHGCNNFCTYCIVPYVRGRERSRDPDSILSEIDILDSTELREITLLGQNVNSYQGNKDNRIIAFPELLEQISKRIRNIQWIRFLTSHPKDFSDELIRVIKDNDKICKYIHLPVQNGSNRILERMNRKYTVDYYLELIEKIKTVVPNLALSTDILVGFPGEEDKDFEATLEFMKKVRFNEAFMYYYNPREGTKAVNFDNPVPEKIRLERLAKVIELQREITRQEKEKQLFTVQKVLVENRSKRDKEILLGRTERNEMVVFAGKEDRIGTFCFVRIESLEGNTFKGIIT